MRAIVRMWMPGPILVIAASGGAEETALVDDSAPVAEDGAAYTCGFDFGEYSNYFGVSAQAGWYCNEIPKPEHGWFDGIAIGSCDPACDQAGMNSNNLTDCEVARHYYHEAQHLFLESLSNIGYCERVDVHDIDPSEVNFSPNPTIAWDM